MTIHSRIYVEFSVAYLRTLVNKGSTPMCRLNDWQVACIQDPTMMRRLIVYPLPLKTTYLQPSTTYTLIISGIIQPTALDSYAKIWVGIDADDNLANGLQEQGDISDTTVSLTQPTYLQSTSYAYSSYKIRQSRVMISNLTPFPSLLLTPSLIGFNFTCAARTIISNRLAII